VAADRQKGDRDELLEANRQLREQLQSARDQLAMINAELAETNKGVVALYAELDDKAEQLRHVSELKSRFLSYISHEFRTPLGAVRSLARLLLDRLDGELTAEQEKQVQLIQSSAVELSVMVDDLLDLAKVEAGRITVSPEWFDMVDLFAALRGMFKPILANATTVLVFEEPVDVPRIYTDDRKLSQILRNFISNAIKFTDRGEVRVTARRSSPDHVTFAVIDTGIGIEAEQLAHLFQDFTRVESAITRHKPGTGLGLSLSKRLAAVLGGSVAAESQPGRGSTFSVTIPIHYEQAAGPPARESRGRGSSDG
jgi:signal transduction histidine kinase